MQPFSVSLVFTGLLMCREESCLSLSAHICVTVWENLLNVTVAILAKMPNKHGNGFI